MSSDAAQAAQDATATADDRGLGQEHQANDAHRSAHGEVGDGAAADGERDALEAYTFGRTPALTLGDAVGEGRASGDGTVVRSGQHPEQRVLRPTLAHRPSSLVSRLSTSSTGSGAGALPAPRPYAVPPGLAAQSPVPPPSLSSAASTSTITRQDTSQFSAFPSAPRAAVPNGQPRSARITYEPPIPLDVQLLLLTTPPPPQRKKVVITAPAAKTGDEAAAAERARRARERDLRDEKSLVRRVKAFRLINDGVRNFSGRRPSEEAGPELPMTPLKGSETLDLNRQRRDSAESASRRTGRIDSHAPAEFVPKTWKDFELAYAAGQLDIEDPPFPPISPSSSVSTTFPSRRQPIDASKLSPYEAGHFPAPLHLSPVTHIRERVIAQLDLLGETYLLPGAPAPQPPSFAASFGPSAGSSVESRSSGQHDSLAHFASSAGSGRRDSNGSTAPSTAYSHASAKSYHPFASPAVFPTYASSHASPPIPTYSSRTSSSLPASPVLDGLSAISLRNHPTLVSLLHRALYAPLGSPALFKPAPKAAIITLFPSASSSSNAVTLLASVNLPARVTTFPITHALDAHVLLNGERGLVIADTERDWRWRHNEVICSSASNSIHGPASATQPGLGIRFYAGMPIFAPSLPSLAHLEEEAGGRVAIGTIALLDDWPRMSKFGSSERAKLRSLASEITREIEDFLRDREKHNFARRGSISSSGGSRRPSHAHSAASAAAAQQASANMARSRSDSHAKKVSFDANGGPHEGGYVDYNSVSRRGSVDERDRAPTPAPSGPLPEPPAPLSSYGLPPMLASNPSASIFAAACTSLAEKLDLALVYLVSLDLSSCPAAPSVAGSPSLELVAAHNLPPDANASFDLSLHLRALRAPEGGLLYRSPAASSSASPAMREAAKGGFASGILLPVAEVESPARRGWVLAGYTTDRKRRWNEGEMAEFEKVRDQLAKVVFHKEAA